MANLNTTHQCCSRPHRVIIDCAMPLTNDHSRIALGDAQASYDKVIDRFPV